MSAGQLLIIACIGVAASFLNVVGGGGSLLTMPILIFLGLPSAIANGTNRIAIIVENITAVANFKKKGFFDLKLGALIGIPAMVGAVIGSNIAVNLSDALFNRVLSVVMLVVMALILWEPQKKLMNYDEKLNGKRKVIAAAAFFFVGIYGGLIQAGVGFIIIVSLALIAGFSLVKINSLKAFVVLVYTLPSLIVFTVNGKVNWPAGLALGFGSAVGAYIGSSFAVKKGDKYIKIVLLISVLAMSAKISGLFNF